MRSLLMTLMLLVSGNLFAEKVTTQSLLREMVELHRLAEFPQAPYKTVQFSSFD